MRLSKLECPRLVAEAVQNKLNPHETETLPQVAEERVDYQMEGNHMKHKIAILSDIHGNATALEAVIADAKNQGSVNTGFWEIFFFLARRK